MKIDSPKVLDRLKRKVIGTEKSPPMNSIAKVDSEGAHSLAKLRWMEHVLTIASSRSGKNMLANHEKIAGG
jgi:hypothetical protein